MRRRELKNRIEQTFRIECKHLRSIVDFGPSRTTILCQASGHSLCCGQGWSEANRDVAYPDRVRKTAGAMEESEHERYSAASSARHRAAGRVRRRAGPAGRSVSKR